MHLVWILFASQSGVWLVGPSYTHAFHCLSFSIVVVAVAIISCCSFAHKTKRKKILIIGIFQFKCIFPEKYKIHINLEYRENPFRIGRTTITIVLARLTYTKPQTQFFSNSRGQTNNYKRLFGDSCIRVDFWWMLAAGNGVHKIGNVYFFLKKKLYK